jgi:hypothetical protein
MTAVLPEEESTPSSLPDGRRAIDDTLARRAIIMMDASGVVQAFAGWKAEVRRGTGGRPEHFSTRALLVAMTLCAITDQPMHASRFCDVMFHQLSPAIRLELGIPDPPDYRDHRGWDNAYRTVRYRLHSICGLIDPSPRPKGRRLGDALFLALTEQRRAELTDEEWSVRYERLTWAINQIIEASLALVPPELRSRWRGSVGVDATLIESYARAEKRAKGTKGRPKPPVSVHSADPDASWYSRLSDERDKHGPVTRGKVAWGHEATLVISGPDDPDAPHEFPHLVVAMAPLHRPGQEVGHNAIVALTNLRSRGHPAHWLAADRAYTSAKAEDFQLPARALEYDLVLDYKKDQLGVKATWAGFIQVEGSWFCPMMPMALIDATLDYRQGRIDRATYDKHLAERQNYLARPKGRPDTEGHLRMQCPAAGYPIARCERKEESIRPATAGRTRIPVTSDDPGPHPLCCTQQSVTIPPEAGAKFHQTLAYGSEEWQKTYSSLRNNNEGIHGFFKDGAREAVGDPGRRRILGTAAQSLTVAFLLAAANVRKIETSLENADRIGSHKEWCRGFAADAPSHSAGGIPHGRRRPAHNPLRPDATKPGRSPGLRRALIAAFRQSAC